jgi:hypothetical protein
MGNTYRRCKDLFPPRMLLYQLPLRNLPRLADDVRDLVEVESWMNFRCIDVVRGGVVQGRSDGTQSSSSMDHVLGQLEGAKFSEPCSDIRRLLLTDGLFSAATLSSTKKTTSLNRFSATSSGAILGDSMSAVVKTGHLAGEQGSLLFAL